MKSSRILKLAIPMAICIFALVFTAGCGLFPNPFAGGGGSSSSQSSSSISSSSTQTSKSSSASTQQSKSTGGTGGLTVDSAKAQGYQVFEGTVHVCNAKEVIDLQKKNIDPAAAGGGGTYAILVFDNPTPVTGQLGDGSGESTKTSEMLGVAEHTDYSSFVIDYGNLDYWKTIDGQHVTVAAKAADISFPSDVRLPIGEPSAKSSIVIS